VDVTQRAQIDEREELRRALDEHAPALTGRYDAAVRLVKDATFPWRLHLVAHAVREIANALPEELFGLKSRRELDLDLDDIARAWKERMPPDPHPEFAVTTTTAPAAQTGLPSDLVARLSRFFHSKATSPKGREAAEEVFAWSDPFNRAQSASLGPVLNAWIDVTRWFVKVVHAPRRANEERASDRLRELPERFAAFERALGGLFRGFFAVQADLEAIVERRGPAGLDEIVPLLAGAEQRRQFFERLDDPAWIEPLEDKGFFARPDEPIVDEETVRHPVWPPGRYLRRMAGRPEAQMQVARIASALASTGNATVRRDLVDIALTLPPELARPLAAQAALWIGTPGPFGLPREMGALAGRLLDAGHSQDALDVWKALLGFARRPPNEHSGWLWPPAVEPHVDTVTLRDIIDRHLTSLVAARPHEVVELLSQRLNAALKARRQDEADGNEDHLEISLHDLRRSQGSSSSYEVVLVCALRDALVQTVAGGGLTLTEALKLLEKRPWRVFERLIMHLLAQSSGQDLDAVTRYLVDRPRLERFDAEYQRLLHTSFSRLIAEQRGRILSWVDRGPSAYDDEPETERSDEDRVAIDRWRWRILGLVAADLPEEWQSRWSALRVTFGDPPPLGTDPFRRSFGHVVLKSPFDADTLRRLSVAEQVERMAAWRPSSSDGPFTNHEGMGETLCALVGEDPERYAADARRLIALPPTLVRAAIRGWTAAVEAQHDFSWDGVLDLGRWVAAQPPNEKEDMTFGPDRGWGWTWTAFGRLLSLAFDAKAGAAGLPRELRAKVSGLVAALMPAPPKGKRQAIETLVDYAMWVREGSPPSSPLAADLPEVASLLVGELGPRAPVEAYRALGSRLPWLLHLDPRWVDSHRGELFPVSLDRVDQWREIWSEFVRSRQHHPHNSYRVLREEYGRAVENLTYGVAKRDQEYAAECLAWDLVVLYLWNDIDVDGLNPLLGRFFDVAPKSLRQHLLWQAASEIENALKLGPQVIDRLKALWESRIVRADSDVRAQEELPSFGWWFARREFDGPWALAQLEGVLRRHQTPKDTPGVVARLAELALTDPRTAARLLRLLTTTPAAPADAVLWLDNARTIMAEAVRSGDDDAHADAMAARDLLGRAGFPEIRQILPLSQDLDDPHAIPYFLWDDPMTVARFRDRLASASEPERLHLLVKLLREARDVDVWKFTTPAEVNSLWPRLSEKVGHKREFWEPLLATWREKGLLARP
jgi:hypothetical protein